MPPCVVTGSGNIGTDLAHDADFVSTVAPADAAPVGRCTRDPTGSQADRHDECAQRPPIQGEFGVFWEGLYAENHQPDEEEDLREKRRKM
jgi:hypothetical protein